MCTATWIMQAVVKCKPDNFSASSLLPPRGGKPSRLVAGINMPVLMNLGTWCGTAETKSRHLPGELEQDVEIHGATGSSATSDSLGLTNCGVSSCVGGAVWYALSQLLQCNELQQSTECEIHQFLCPLLLTLMSALPLSFFFFF